MSTCLSCTAETSNGLALCDRCNQTLTIALVNVAAYFSDTERIQPGQRVKVRSAYQSTPPPAVSPANDRISNTLDEVATIVFGWARNLEDDRPMIGTMPSTTPLRCGWLEHHLPSIRTLEWAGELLREVSDCERSLRRILDRADTGWYAGICGHEMGRRYDEEADEVLPVVCERGLYATQGSRWVTCPECGRTWDAGQRQAAMLDEAKEQLAPVRVIAGIAVGLVDGEVSVERLTRRIEQWVQRGQLDDYGVRVLDGKPRRVYRIGDALKLLKPQVGDDEAAAC